MLVPEIHINMMIGLEFFAYAVIALISVILIEWIFISIYLKGDLKNILILISVIVSNLVSTFLGRGILATVLYDLNKWILSFLNLKIDEHSVIEFILPFIGAYIITVIFEGIINTQFLKKEFESKRIFKGTFYANTITYFLLGILLLVFN